MKTPQWVVTPGLLDMGEVPFPKEAGYQAEKT